MVVKRVALLAALAAIGLTAFDKPNFTGDWTMNIDKSTFGPLPAPDSATMKIVHKEPYVEMTRTVVAGGETMTMRSTITIDGKPATLDTPNGKATYKAEWDGDVLVIETATKAGDEDIRVRARWSQPEGPQYIKIIRTFEGQPSSQSEIYEKAK